jgi:3-oxoacyl-[acyl-carrier protein] reductase
MSRGRVDGKIALVTGASRGIGREIALTLAREGAAVGVNHLPDPEQAALAGAVVEEVTQAGGKATALPADVADHGAVRDAVASLLGAFGRIDILVTNAGIAHRGRLVELTEADWDRVIAVNLKGTFNAIHAVLPHMIERKSGKIITIASELAFLGRAGMPHYAASKAGVIGLTKSVAREVSPLGINVNAVAPGPVDTDLLRSNPEFRYENQEHIPLRRWGHPRDIAASVLFLASEESAYYAGQVLGPNGGVVMP